MYKNALRKMQQCVQQGRCRASSHAFEEMEDDGLDIQDAKRAILNGTIIQRQWDDDYREFKYVIHGVLNIGYEIEVVAKVEPASETVMIITVYRT